MDKVKGSIASVSLIFWHWTPNKAGLCPVKIRIIYRDERRYYPVNVEEKRLFLSEPGWETIQDHKKYVRGDNKKTRDTLTSLVAQAHHAINETTKNNRPFTWERFESEFLHAEASAGFLSIFKEHLAFLKAEKRIGTYMAYNTAYNAFKKFRGEKEIRQGEVKPAKELSPHDITPKLLRSFEEYLEKEGCGKTTVGMYMRSLKVIYNIAADTDPALLENYPFSRRQTDRNKYKIRTGSGHKGDALTIEQLRKLNGLTFSVAESEYKEAKLLWMFSFHCQGMNFKDIALLKYKDIDGDIIKYIRHKTKDTEAKEAVISIPLSDDIREIISEIGNPDKRSNSYVFTIIPNGLATNHARRNNKERTPEQRLVQIIQQKTKMVNKRLRQITKDYNAMEENQKPENKLPVITTYWARHTYANLLKESGQSVALIREALGHSEEKTTRTYLKRFDTEQMRKANEGIGKLLKMG